MSMRAWQIEDLDKLAELEQECFPDPWTRRMLADAFLSDRFYGILLEEDGSAVGYGGMSITLDEAEIELIAVSEMYRRCGRGGEILRELLKLAEKKHVKKVFLEVRVSNAAAQLLYLKNGFCGVYCRSRYYPDGEDAVVMMKELI